MKDYVEKITHENTISVCLFVEKEKVMAIGEKMNAINDLAYMNGYNWEAFFNYYLEKNYPEVFEGMETDPEAGMYAANYELNPENEKKADQFVSIIENLIENESILLEIVEKEGEAIAWD